jgi:hypothetical protein
MANIPKLICPKQQFTTPISGFTFTISSKVEQSDPPPLKWSDLKYVLWHQGGSEHAKEEAHA